MKGCSVFILVVPLLYQSHNECVVLLKAHPMLYLRSLSIGSNGRDFMFLLKGHEDLRQDERVMQLFGLVNTLLTNDPETFKRHLRYYCINVHHKVSSVVSNVMCLYAALSGTLSRHCLLTRA